MKEPIFISRAVVEMIHRRSLAEHGGQDGIRDEAALDSALLAPVHTYCYGTCDLFLLAAGYAFHLAENQPFLDGNKRTAISAALMFLEANGIRTSPVTNAQLYEAMIAIAEKRLDKAAFAAVFRSRLSP